MAVTVDNTSLADCSFCQQMSPKIPTCRGRRQIVQEEEDKEEKEEEEITHPNKFKQFQDIDANSSSLLSDGDICISFE